MPRGKKWPAGFKAKLVLETLTEDRTISQVAGDHGLNPNLVSRWRAESVDHAGRVFAADEEKAERGREKRRAQGGGR